MADFTALKSAIQTYIKQNGNEEITGEKLQEILLSMVTTLGDSAINDLITALADEVAARQNADGTLQQNITNEATARGNADTALGGRIDDEATARANADAALGTRIDNEATARGNADTALSNRLGSTITAENTAADQIGAEAEAREAADTVLQGLIDGITNNIENGYVYAGIATPSSTPATGKVFYLALTAGTYTNFGNTEVSQGINILKYNGSAWSLDAFIGIDDEPITGSDNLVNSGGVAMSNLSKVATRTKTNDADLAFGDALGNYDILRVKDGHVRTKNFNSQEVSEDISGIKRTFTPVGAITNDADLAFGDALGNYDILRVKDGHIRTKNFNSQEVSEDISDIERDVSGVKRTFTPVDAITSDAEFAISDENLEYDILRIINGYPKTKNFDGQAIANADKPASYFNDYLTTRIEDLRKRQFSIKKGDVFIFYTDNHNNGEKENAKVIAYLLDNLTMKKVVFGGDAIVSGSSSTKQEIIDSWYKADEVRVYTDKKGARFYPVRGNHELSTGVSEGGFSFNQGTVHDMLMQQTSIDSVWSQQEDQSVNYYFDNQANKIRYIVVDYLLAPNEDTNHGYANATTEERLAKWAKTDEWLYDILMELDEGWKVVMLMHTGALDLTSAGNSVDGYVESFYTPLIEAAKNKSTFNSYDFSQFKGDIIMQIGGHRHLDAQIYNDGIPNIITDKNYATSSNVDVVGSVVRSANSYSSLCLDIVFIDIENSMIYLERVGCGRSRYFTLTPIEVAEGSSVSLTTSLSGTVTWGEYEDGTTISNSLWNKVTGSIASVSSNGTVTGVSVGNATVYATNGNKIEFFNINVKQF